MKLHWIRPALIVLSASVLMIACSEELPLPRILGVEPSAGPSDREMRIVVRGEAFTSVTSVDGEPVVASDDLVMVARLGGTALRAVRLIEPDQIEAWVPAGLAPGVRDLTLGDARARAVTLVAAYEVLAPEGPEGSASRADAGVPPRLGSGADPVDAGEPANAAAPDAAAPDAAAADARPLCVPSSEVCNGFDDSCDGRVDEGCFSGRVLKVGSRQLTASAGQEGPNEWTPDLTCPEGQVLTGIHGGAGVLIDRAGALCGLPTVTEDRATTPFTYRFVMEPGVRRPAQGGTGGIVIERRCPPDQVVVGMIGRHEQAINQLALLCAPLQLAMPSVLSAGATPYLLRPGSSTLQEQVGGQGGTDYRLDCASGSVAVDLGGSDGNYTGRSPEGSLYVIHVVRALRLACAPLEAEVR